MQKRWVAMSSFLGLFSKQPVSLNKRFESLLKLAFKHLWKLTQQGFVGLDLLLQFADASDQVFVRVGTRFTLLRPFGHRSFVAVVKRVHGWTVSSAHGWNKPVQEAVSEPAGSASASASRCCGASVPGITRGAGRGPSCFTVR